MIQKFFDRSCFASQSSASLKLAVRILAGCGILAAAIVPAAGAAPQSDLGNLSPATPGAGPDVQQAGGFTPDKLSGKLSATPPSVSFSSVPVGLTNTQTISLKNNGSTAVRISRSSVSGTAFRVLDLSNSTVISPGHSVSFNISFTPSSATSYSATASIYSNASNSTVQISVSGTGTASKALLGVSPASLSFGNVTIGSSNTLSVSLTDSGNLSVTISKISVPSAVFTTSGAPAGTILAPGQKATLKVTYSPTSATNAGGSVSISTSGSGSSTNISVAGAGVKGSAESVSLNWQASTSKDVVGYYVYRSSISGGPYAILNSSPDGTTQYTDPTVLAGSTYYYVVSSVDSSNMQSNYSSQVMAKIPAQ